MWSLSRNSVLESSYLISQKMFQIPLWSNTYNGHPHKKDGQVDYGLLLVYHISPARKSLFEDVGVLKGTSGNVWKRGGNFGGLRRAVHDASAAARGWWPSLHWACLVCGWPTVSNWIHLGLVSQALGMVAQIMCLKEMAAAQNVRSQSIPGTHRWSIPMIHTLLTRLNSFEIICWTPSFHTSGS